ncbi:hypothetical protein [Rhizobium sp. LC145]|uniref:hypothetical protein n=1 Tax=Rhizobium sp. LC145 TaxID=1120688 RepID=UPI000629F470|nr:hypothetical protein [Rhizobium sp. LC145]KKX33383.1 hypothetical protein YH62_07750 [Rhizobium sp. LC145]TKT58632.1 hypothetical protein FDR95_10970 [Rhizobiaceae bacterium LC148]
MSANAERLRGRPPASIELKAALFFSVLLATSFGLGAATSLAGALAGFVMIVALPALVLTLLVGTAIFLLQGIRLARRPGRAVGLRIANIVVAPLLGLGAFAFGMPAFSTGSLAGAWLRLVDNRSQYEAIIASSVSGQRNPADDQHRAERRIRFIADSGPPLRVAFDPQGILDNWSAIVFDPTQVVMGAAGFDPASGKFAAPDSITKLFGGDLVQCRRLGDSYFFCSFT